MAGAMFFIMRRKCARISWNSRHEEHTGQEEGDNVEDAGNGVEGNLELLAARVRELAAQQHIEDVDERVASRAHKERVRDRDDESSANTGNGGPYLHGERVQNVARNSVTVREVSAANVSGQRL